MADVDFLTFLYWRKHPPTNIAVYWMAMKFASSLEHSKFVHAHLSICYEAMSEKEKRFIKNLRHSPQQKYGISDAQVREYAEAGKKG